MTTTHGLAIEVHLYDNRAGNLGSGDTARSLTTVSGLDHADRLWVRAALRRDRRCFRRPADDRQRRNSLKLWLPTDPGLVAIPPRATPGGGADDLYRAAGRRSGDHYLAASAVS